MAVWEIDLSGDRLGRLRLLDGGESPSLSEGGSLSSECIHAISGGVPRVSTRTSRVAETSSSSPFLISKSTLTGSSVYNERSRFKTCMSSLGGLGLISVDQGSSLVMRLRHCASFSPLIYHSR